ncbi:hemolysin III family protein [bacterium]|nr:hemolysin III family protein [bacterium]
MKISRRHDSSPKVFFKRTIAAQIHLITFFFTIVGLGYLLPLTKPHGELQYWGSVLYGVTSMMVFGTSAMYHFLHDGFHLGPNLTELMEKLDQFAIYLFIAGSYTPFIINVIAPPWKNILIISVWSLALIGILYTLFRHKLPLWAQSRVFYTGVFVLMGWTIVVRLGEVIDRASTETIAFLVGGALAYSVGAIVYATKKPKLWEGFFGFHELWHVFVTLGFALHYCMVLNFYS